MPRHCDPESELYYYRTRYLDPNAGRFTTRDSIGIWGDPNNLGNGYTYVGNNPWTILDPFGLDWIAIHTTFPNYLNFNKSSNGIFPEWDPHTGHVWIEYFDESEKTRTTYGLWPDDSNSRWEGFDMIENDPNNSDLRINVELGHPIYLNPDASRYYELTEEEIESFNQIKDEWLNANKIYSLMNKNCVTWTQAILNGVLNENYTGIGVESGLDLALNYFIEFDVDSPIISTFDILFNVDPIRSPWGLGIEILERESNDPTHDLRNYINDLNAINPTSNRKY